MRDRFARNAVVGLGFAAVAVGIVFVIDLLSIPPIEAVVTDVGERRGTYQEATVVWDSGTGEPLEARVNVPPEFDGGTVLPIVVTRNGEHLNAYVDDGRISLRWYLAAAVVGVLLGWPVGRSLRPADYEETPVRMTAWHVN
ncbi:MAG: hypothetical protein PVG83_02930 [Acidimicrobiia bacterium]|jgi:hypothetical protein